LVWGLGACLYLIAFYQRVAPAVITRELSREFALSAAALGNLSAFYFYSYVAVQIPTGLLADRFGPRRVLSMGAAICAAGTLLFALAPGVAWANAGRLAIGAAGGVAFVSMLKLASHWMPPRRFAFVSGIALFTGVLGATLAGVPLRAAVESFGWRAVMGASAAVTAMVAIAIWLIVRDDPTERGYASYHPEPNARGQGRGIASLLREVFAYRNTWLLFLAGGGFTSLVLTFPGLWGVPYLVTVRGFTPTQAAATASTMLIAWSVASLGFAPLSEHLRRRKVVMLPGLGVTLAIWSLVVFAPLPSAALVAALLAAAISSAAFVVTFAFAKESVPAHLAGTASGVANMGVVMGGMVMQPLVGVILDLRWEGTLVDGVRVYGADAYRWGFAAILVWGLAALGLIAATKETRCRPLGWKGRLRRRNPVQQARPASTMESMPMASARVSCESAGETTPAVSVFTMPLTNPCRDAAIPRRVGKRSSVMSVIEGIAVANPIA
jgi:MFS family permease